jgi:CheY-like chemotaxis protein
MNLIEKALIVDDEYHIRKYMGLVLRSMGVTTICEATTGAEGVDAYTREQPDLVLLDVNMPVMDGIEALLKIRSINADASIVMLTSLATRHTIEQAVDGGALHYIRKDTPRAELIALLTGLLAEKNQVVS